MDIDWTKKIVLLFIAYIGFIQIVMPTIRGMTSGNSKSFTNCVSKNESITMRLLYSSTKNNSDGHLIWENTNIRFLPQKFLLKKQININIPTNMLQNRSTVFLILQAEQNNKGNKTYLNSIAGKPLVRWRTTTNFPMHYLFGGDYLNNKLKIPIQSTFPITYKTFRFDLVDLGEKIQKETLHQFVQKRVIFNETDSTYSPIVRYDAFFDIHRQRKSVDIKGNVTSISFNVEINIRKHYLWAVKETISSLIHIAKKYSTKYKILEYFLAFFDEIFEQIRMVIIDTPDIALIALFTLFLVNYITMHFTFKIHKNYKYAPFNPNTSLLTRSSNALVLLGVGTYCLFPNIHLGLRCSMAFKFFTILIHNINWLKFRNSILRNGNQEKDKTILQQKQHEEYFYRKATIVALILSALFWIQQIYFEKYSSFRFYIMYCSFASSYIVGFPGMLQSNFANFKMKSVPSMSISLIIFKIVSAILDELIYFCKNVSMTMKVQAFRDDFAVVLLLLQLFKYKVDPKRPNDFGLILETNSQKEKRNDKDKEIITDNNGLTIKEIEISQEKILSDGIYHR